ncbi:MAG: ComE operon protein 1 [candidate division WS6 bacterium OLB20]|uniref:ComE operon protein 1 n=1 Tax=candidate division WS6 bacterium OLB20 TaxID=1617426 RepID=A0A136LYH8_9BACT|nr:MAG: ComE operon protein 1 [candidate division WS6 bacterium OLB20]
MNDVIREIQSLPVRIQKLLAGLLICVILLTALLLYAAAGHQDEISQDRTSSIPPDSPDSGGSYFVEITGQVANPGVYELAEPRRVIELIDLAGGLTPEADLLFLNRDVALSEVAAEGYKLFIPAAEKTASPSAAGGRISLNSATLEQLMTLPGVGESTALKIIDARPYKSVEDLDNVPGIGEQTFSKLEPLVSL